MMQQREYRIDWEQVTNDELSVIEAIVRRAEKLGRENQLPLEAMGLLANISQAHLNCPLQLQALLEAEEGDFMHDVLGILRHINPRTGELEGYFRPRFAAR